MRVSFALASLALALVVAGPVRAETLSPEETVKRYLAALKAGNFDQAYEVISKAMKQGKDKEVWVKE